MKIRTKSHEHRDHVTLHIAAASAVSKEVVDALMPRAAARCEAEGRIYSLYPSRGPRPPTRENVDFRDPVDGSFISAMRYFDTMDEARAWVEQSVLARREAS